MNWIDLWERGDIEIYLGGERVEADAETIRVARITEEFLANPTEEGLEKWLTEYAPE